MKRTTIKLLRLNNRLATINSGSRPPGTSNSEATTPMIDVIGVALFV